MSSVPVAPAAAALLVALCSALVTRPSSAQIPPGPASAPTSTAEPQPATAPLRVWVENQSEPLDTAALQATLAQELRRDVVLASEPAAADISIRIESMRARVRYVTSTGEHLIRDVELPPDRQRSLQVLSWLTVNLVRDEAKELLEELRARRKLEAEARAAEERAAQAQAEERAAQAQAEQAKATAEKAAAEAARKKAEAESRKPRASDEPIRDRFKAFDVALATPVSLLRDSPQRELRLQLALAYGESGAIRGVAAAPGLLRIRQDLVGAAAALAFVSIGRNAQGGVWSVGYANVAGRLDGAMLGLGVARAGSVRGAMTSIGATLLREPSRAILLACGVNVAGDLTGIELAGAVNVARDFRGIALAPINVHRRVRGLQIGIVNVADEVDGAAIGVISLSRNGRLQPVLWGGADGSVHVALKSIAGYAFTQLGGGIDVDRTSLSYDAGIGAHIRLGKSFFFEPGMHYASTHRTTEQAPPDDGIETAPPPDRSYLYYLVLGGLRWDDTLDVVAGGGVRQTLDGAVEEPAITPEVRVGIGFF
ncbi:MAG TPA: hypothetical protein VJN18_20475 [Polyangiaceae bacterium]|nr:hypothetical protein [Polyangiaceae bacterium]